MGTESSGPPGWSLGGSSQKLWTGVVGEHPGDGPLMGPGDVRRSEMPWWKVIVLAVAGGLLPAVAEAHGLTGTGSWLDELVCLVPAAIMMVLVLVLGRDPKGKGGKTAKSPDPTRDKA